MEHVPVGEGKMHDELARRYNAGAPLTEAEVYSIAERYGAWQGDWAHYLRAAGVTRIHGL